MATTAVLPSLVAAMKDAASAVAIADQVVPDRNVTLVIDRAHAMASDRQVPPRREVRVVNSVEDLIDGTADKATAVQSEGPPRLRRRCRTSRWRSLPTIKAWIR